MAKLTETLNNKEYTFDIVLNNESSKTRIKYYLQELNLIDFNIILAIISKLIKRHNIFNKPIIEISTPELVSGKLLDEIASGMSNKTKNLFNKLRIISIDNKYEYDGWDWVEYIRQKHHNNKPKSLYF